MHKYIEAILASRQKHIAEDAAECSYDLLASRLRPAELPMENPVRNIRESNGFIIAEIKKASPSQGWIRRDINVTARAKAYEQAGADAVSVLCEPDYFRGSHADVRNAAQATSVPVLYKDFILDSYQLLQAKEDGASWVLLIVRVLRSRLPHFIAFSRQLGLEPLVEVHSRHELDHAVEAGARLIGINARDLDTFHVDLDLIRQLARFCPASCACIAESGIRNNDDLRSVKDSGAHGVLIGEALMRSDDPASLMAGYRKILGIPSDGVCA